MNPDQSPYRRAQHLYQVQRWQEAIDALGLHLAQQGEDPHALVLLGHCLIRLDRGGEAEAVAGRAIASDPILADGHALLAWARLDQHRSADAEAPAREALRLDPQSAAHHALLANIRLRRDDKKDGLRWAEAGLLCDPEDEDCLDMRATILTLMGRSAEAADAAADALRQAPESPQAHIVTGFEMLRRARHREASIHFREALRIGPDNARARFGLLEALKARNPLYRIWLRYVFFMQRLGTRLQMGLIIGIWLVSRTAVDLMFDHPEWAWLIGPLLGIVCTWAVTTWLANPLSDLLLLLHPLGRHALVGRQRQAALACGALIAVGLAGLGIWWLRDWEPGLFLAIGMGLLSATMHLTLNTAHHRNRHTLLLVHAGLAALLVASLVMLHGHDERWLDFWQCFFYAWFANQFLWAWLSTRNG